VKEALTHWGAVAPNKKDHPTYIIFRNITTHDDDDDDDRLTTPISCYLT